MSKRDEGFSHMDYRNAKVIHLVVKDEVERFIYKKEEITKEEADEIVACYFEERETRKRKKEETL